MRYPRIILAGVTSGVGKTTVTVGLIAALRRRGLKVQPFKAGPDYIDPSYHSVIAQRPCRNLDTWLLSQDAILELFTRQAKLADLSVIEGVMGLYDGLKNQECGSTAHLAKVLKSPVILIVDASSVSRSAGAIVLGYREFDRDVALRGVILNNVGSPTHYRSLKCAIERKTGLAVLGFLPKDKDLTLPERHLGLIPAPEKGIGNAFIPKLCALTEKNIDIKKILKICSQAQPLPQPKSRLFTRNAAPEPVKIALASDLAFNFYYQDNLDILKHYGADLMEFSPLCAQQLPQGAKGLYIGGGFPELYASRLSQNTGLKKDIFEKAKEGMPIYAECGGLMYLSQELFDFEAQRFPMVGVFNLTVKMDQRLRALGYVSIEAKKNTILTSKGSRLKAHMFHWSYLEAMKRKENFAYRVKKDKQRVFFDGLVKGNVLASYAHLHFGSDIRLAKNFIRCCREYKNRKLKP